MQCIEEFWKIEIEIYEGNRWRGWYWALGWPY